MTSIVLIGVDPELNSKLQPRLEGMEVGVRTISEPNQAVLWMEYQREPLLAALVGAQVDDPVRLAQRINRLDREVAVLILTFDDHHSQISRAIQFTPFLGDHVTTHPSGDVTAIAETLREAVLRGRQRRSFRTTISAMNEQLQTLSTHRVSAVQYLDHLLDHAPVGVVALDPEGHIISSNQRAGQILEQRERELLGRSLLQVFPENERERVRGCLADAALAHTRSLNEVFERRVGNGNIQYIAATAAGLPVESGERGTLVILQDVTTQVLGEQEREAALQLRDEFLSVAAHELKTPLTSIKGFVGLLERQFQQQDWDQARITRLHGQLLTQVDRLELLVADLLDASRIRQGRLDPRPESMDLAALAKRVLQRFEEAPITTPGHRLVLDAPAQVTGFWDPDRIDQVITNLVSNGLKYSPDGGEVRVVVRECDGQAVLVVTDEGVGINPELHSSLFQPFMRGDSGGNVPGTGLGLHITSKIVEQHRGSISVASTPGQGSTFTIWLPLDSSQLDQPGETAQDTPLAR